MVIDQLLHEAITSDQQYGVTLVQQQRPANRAFSHILSQVAYINNIMKLIVLTEDVCVDTKLRLPSLQSALCCPYTSLMIRYLLLYQYGWYDMKVSLIPLTHDVLPPTIRRNMCISLLLKDWQKYAHFSYCLIGCFLTNWYM